MPAAYSLDLRLKALAAVARGEKKSHVSRTLNISRNTLDLWLKRREQTGSPAAKVYRHGPDPKINNLETFREFAEREGHRTALEMAQLWPEPVSDVTLGKALKRIEFTRKKRLTGTGREMKQNAKPFLKL